MTLPPLPDLSKDLALGGGTSDSGGVLAGLDKALTLQPEQEPTSLNKRTMEFSTLKPLALMTRQLFLTPLK